MGTASATVCMAGAMGASASTRLPAWSAPVGLSGAANRSAITASGVLSASLPLGLRGARLGLGLAAAASGVSAGGGSAVATASTGAAALRFLRGLRVGATRGAGVATSAGSASGVEFSSSLMLDRSPHSRPEKRGSQDSTKPFRAVAGSVGPTPLGGFQVFFGFKLKFLSPRSKSCWARPICRCSKNNFRETP